MRRPRHRDPSGDERGDPRTPRDHERAHDPHDHDPHDHDPHDCDPHAHDDPRAREPHGRDPHDYDHDPHDYDPHDYDPHDYDPRHHRGPPWTRGHGRPPGPPWEHGRGGPPMPPWARGRRGGPHGRPHGRGIRGYVRSHLHRRIFVWFGATIVTTAIFVGLTAWLTSRAESASWMQDFDRVRRFSAGRFAVVWDDPPRRTELARAIARDLDVSVSLRDGRGRMLGRWGPRCARAQWTLPVGEPIPRGSVELCIPRRGSLPWWRLALPLAVGVIVLWAITGKIARKIARPLGSLTDVTRDLGDGKLKSRVRLGRQEPGEVGALADAINDMAERIERQLADQRELLAAVSHELRTPLSRIRLLVELLSSRTESAGGDTAKLLGDLDREVVEIDALVGELLAASRLDFAALERKPVDGAEVGLRALDRAGLDVSLFSTSGAVSLHADPTLLSRALANLLDNARKHAGGVVALRVEGRPGGLGTGGALEVAFEVDDAGDGFKEGDETRVFQAFYRGENGDRGRHDPSSLGLGLSLVRRIAEAHGGHAYARNRNGGGATVGIAIPAVPPDAS